MPYITTEQVKEKRNEIKKAFPNWKISVSRRHHSTIVVSILAAPIKLTEKKYEQVNHFYIHEHYTGEAKEALMKINNIASKGVRELVNDADYGSVPTFYTDINIGEWDNPFIYTGN